MWQFRHKDLLVQCCEKFAHGRASAHPSTLVAEHDAPEDRYVILLFYQHYLVPLITLDLVAVTDYLGGNGAEAAWTWECLVAWKSPSP